VRREEARQIIGERIARQIGTGTRGRGTVLQLLRLEFLEQQKRQEKENEARHGPKRSKPVGKEPTKSGRRDYHLAKYKGFVKRGAPQLKKGGYLRRKRAQGRLGAC